VERDNEGVAVTHWNTCKQCEAVFSTLVDEKSDECTECLLADIEGEK